MNRHQIILRCTVMSVIAWQMLALCALFSTATAETKHNDRSSTQPPTRETIPEDAPAEVRKLMEKLLSGDYRDRVEAVIDTKRMGQRATPLVPYLIDNLGNEGSVSVGSLASDALNDLGKTAVESLIAGLEIRQYKAQKPHIINLLGRIGDHRAIPALIVAMEDDDTHVRWQAVRALVDMPDPRAFEPLMRHLRDRDDEVASIAIWALGEIGDRRAVEPIISVLVESGKLGEGGVGVRRSAAKALGKLGDRRAFEPLLATYKDEEMKKRPDRTLLENALTAIGRTKDPQAFDVLQKSLKDGDSTHSTNRTTWERVAAVWGLAGIGDARSIALLKAILKDERPTDKPTAKWWKTGRIPRIRPEAASALVSTGDDGAIDAVYEEYKISPQIVDKEINQGVMDSLKDWHFRTAAVDALAMSPKPQAYLKVIDILGGTDTRMRYEAARVLYCSTISQLLSETDISPYERSKLPALNDMRVLQALMKVAESKPPPGIIEKQALKMFWETQEYALKALQKSGNPEAKQFVDKIEKEE